MLQSKTDINSMLNWLHCDDYNYNAYSFPVNIIEKVEFVIKILMISLFRRMYFDIAYWIFQQIFSNIGNRNLS